VSDAVAANVAGVETGRRAGREAFETRGERVGGEWMGEILYVDKEGGNKRTHSYQR